MNPHNGPLNFRRCKKKSSCLFILFILPFPTTKCLYLDMEDSILEQNDGCFLCDIPGTNTLDKF